MSDVVVVYHHESEGWWAETADLPRFSAAGASYAEVYQQVRAALPKLLQVDDSNLREVIYEELDVTPLVDVKFEAAPLNLLSTNQYVSAGSPIARSRRFNLLRDAMTGSAQVSGQ